MSGPSRAQIIPRGPFSLQAAAEFGFGPNEGQAMAFDGAMRLAFPVDGGSGYAGLVLRQDDVDGPVLVELDLRGGATADRAIAQAARIVSLDDDGAAFARLGDTDLVLGELLRLHLGQRPVLFPSPYEAAAWSIISARRPAAQAAAVRVGIADRFGTRFELAGVDAPAFPQPEKLLVLPEDHPGLNPEKVHRLRAVAGAARDGMLDVERLHQLGAERAYEELQRLPGIGPFYAGLIVLRASGFADAPLLTAEPRVMGHAARLYGRPELADDLHAFRELAERWRPFRTWATVLIRLAGNRAGSASAPPAATQD